MPRAKIPGASHQHAISGDTRHGEPLLTACKRATSDSGVQPTAYFRRPVSAHQLSSRHGPSPRHVGRGQCSLFYISLGLAAHHLSHPYNRNRVSGSNLHDHAIGHYANWSLSSTSSYCRPAFPDDTGSITLDRSVEPLLDQRIHRAGSSQALRRDGGTHLEDPRGSTTHQEESPT